MMGLETLLEAAKFLEYKAEVEARGEKGFPALPSNSSSALLLSSSSSSSNTNGYTTNNHHNNHHHHHHQNNVIHQNGGGHYAASSPSSSSSSSLPYHNSKIISSNASSIPRAVPESANGYKLSDHSYRRGQLNTSPIYEFNGGTNRASKGNNSSSSSSSSSIISNSRNSGTREVHNKLEKNRRAHLKECFEMLKGQLPSFEDRKISNLAILRSSLRYIQTLKRKEREFEHEMERLARDKIALQQRLSTLKKDMLGKWDHLDWRAIVPEDLELELDQPDGAVDYARKQQQEQLVTRKMSSSPDDDGNQAIESDPEEEESDDSHNYPISLSMSNGHHNGDRMMSEKKHYGQINGINGMSGPGPISLVTATKLSSSPLAAITVEKTANSPVGGASFVNCITSSPTAKGFSVLSNSTMAINSRMDMGQYYDEEKMCK
ncbi:myotubularin-related protein DDB_G0290005 isoform X2 [Folsomia candida]|uniref:myotubularin-related protein DDB_G0290005 isoform X2 n=1 Tax=Folsomia candida TaxID=158441 RepID=UPI000B8F26FC|nr:myotubularin-related protein DDB_G0290005 isoform X2 [Folsomia candida]XP_021943367.1 myotubularin-related protein DDB_G0290005 isoform X2 [Folsomia candida]